MIHNTNALTYIKSNIIYIIGCLGAMMTSVYSFRLIYKVFHGDTELSAKQMVTIKESPKVMLFPLLVLDRTLH